MVSAAKMRKAVNNVLAIRTYAHNAWHILTNLAEAFKSQNGLLEIREVNSMLAILITSNRGLCGSFNSQMAKKIKDELANPERLMVNRIKKNHPVKSPQSGVGKAEFNRARIDFITVGKKGDALLRRMQQNTIAAFPNLNYSPTIEDVRPLVKIITSEYLNKKYDKVVVFYTDYVSTINQKTKVRQLLPISKVDLEKQIAEMDTLAKEHGVQEPIIEYKVEPSPQEVLEYIIPRLIEMQVYHAILESNASKESARMLAMRNATEAAGEMAEDLTFIFNQIRQMKITQEIAEISAGRAALSN